MHNLSYCHPSRDWVVNSISIKNKDSTSEYLLLEKGVSGLVIAALDCFDKTIYFNPHPKNGAVSISDVVSRFREFVHCCLKYELINQIDNSQRKMPTFISLTNQDNLYHSVVNDLFGHFNTMNILDENLPNIPVNFKIDKGFDFMPFDFENISNIDFNFPYNMEDVRRIQVALKCSLII